MEIAKTLRVLGSFAWKLPKRVIQKHVSTLDVAVETKGERRRLKNKFVVWKLRHLKCQKVSSLYLKAFLRYLRKSTSPPPPHPLPVGIGLIRYLIGTMDELFHSRNRTFSSGYFLNRIHPKSYAATLSGKRIIWVCTFSIHNRFLDKVDSDILRTVLSGAEERGVDGPCLDRSYFSRLQPISFLFFDPSSSHIAALVAHIWYSISMLHTHATHAGVGKRLKCFDTSTWSRFEVSNAADEVVFIANVLCV